jgi:hypothetical protein
VSHVGLDQILTQGAGRNGRIEAKYGVYPNPEKNDFRPLATARRNGAEAVFMGPVIPENYIRTDSRGSAESAHDPTRCAWS